MGLAYSSRHKHSLIDGENQENGRVVLLYAASGIPPSYMFEESFYLGQGSVV